MIDMANPKWRALCISDLEGIEYLKRMFHRGWYVSPFGMDDITHLVLTVPTVVPKRINFTTDHQILDAQKQPSQTIIVLHKGQHPDRQTVVVHPKDASGYIVKGEDTPAFKTWKLITALPLANGSIAHIHELRTFSDE